MTKIFIKIYFTLLALTTVSLLVLAYVINIYVEKYSEQELFIQEIILEIPHGSSLLKVSNLLGDVDLVDDAREAVGPHLELQEADEVDALADIGVG